MKERAEGLRSLDVFSKPKAAIQVKTKTGAFRMQFARAFIRLHSYPFSVAYLCDCHGLSVHIRAE
jgi:hypothetical protein